MYKLIAVIRRDDVKQVSVCSILIAVVWSVL